ncbi:MAG: divergent PAP2 family protein [Candidatus Peregrinibacteria bacterium]|nr:divergent PAP2 family protein [Candidatus Peregrinibacteria bacterium]MCB9808151.1 divergent PAP2 family protein [Candidatus Peribacteria bacterium]
MTYVQELLAEYPFSICVFVMIISEVAKHINEGIRGGLWFKHGGMPSSHSAFVISLMMIVGTIDGIQSTTFAIATVFAGIVWYDAAFVRKQVGKQAKALNILQQFEEFSERVGHSVSEVAGGIIFGGVLTYFLLSWVA